MKRWRTLADIPPDTELTWCSPDDGDLTQVAGKTCSEFIALAREGMINKTDTDAAKQFAGDLNYVWSKLRNQHASIAPNHSRVRKWYMVGGKDRKGDWWHRHHKDWDPEFFDDCAVEIKQNGKVFVYSPEYLTRKRATVSELSGDNMIMPIGTLGQASRRGEEPTLKSHFDAMVHNVLLQSVPLLQGETKAGWDVRKYLASLKRSMTGPSKAPSGTSYLNQFVDLGRDRVTLDSIWSRIAQKRRYLGQTSQAWGRQLPPGAPKNYLHWCILQVERGRVAILNMVLLDTERAFTWIRTRLLTRKQTI